MGSRIAWGLRDTCGLMESEEQESERRARFLVALSRDAEPFSVRVPVFLFLVASSQGPQRLSTQNPNAMLNRFADWNL